MAKPRKVWVVRGVPSGTPLGGRVVAWIVGVYGTKESAKTAAEAEREEYRKRGKVVWGDPGDDENECDWDIDITVEAYEVQP